RVHGYDPVNPHFNVINGDDNGQMIKVGGTGRSDLVPSWKGGVYYTVNVTVRHGDKFYRCIKTHTALTSFESEYWMEVVRPQYADGTSLLWYLESEQPTVIRQVAYGTVLKRAQDVANLLNGYDRYLGGQGWQLNRVTEDGFDL